MKVENNRVFWMDGSTSVFDDGKEKDFEMLLEHPDIQDQFTFPYPEGEEYGISYNIDPGRIRNTEFFKKVYGSSRAEVEQNLVKVVWLPETLGKTISFNSKNGAAEQLQKVSDELDGMMEFHKYLDDPAGTYNWRMIAGTDRLSAHSFAIAIDINIKYASYWKWDMKDDTLTYRNMIPMEIVRVFEKYGFLWGGKWYHYDTMHFEYRPEMVRAKQ